MMIYKPNLFLKVVNWPELIEWFLLSNSTNSPVFSTLSIGYAIPANPGWKPRALAAQLVVDGPHKVTESAGLPAAESPLGTVNYEPYIELDGFWKAWRRWACRTGAGWGYGGRGGTPLPRIQEHVSDEKNLFFEERTCSCTSHWTTDSCSESRPKGEWRTRICSSIHLEFPGAAGISQCRFAQIEIAVFEGLFSTI